MLVARTLSSLAKLKLDLSALYCFVVSQVVLVPVLLLHSLSLSCSEQSAQLKGSAGCEISAASELREIPVALCIDTSKCSATGTSLTSAVVMSVVFVSERGKGIWY